MVGGMIKVVLLINVVVVVAALQLAISSTALQYPYDGPTAVQGNVGPDSMCASNAATSLIGSAPPDVWNRGSIGCGRSVVITCVLGQDSCSANPTITVTIIDEAYTDCGERFILSADAFSAIAGPYAESIAIDYELI